MAATTATKMGTTITASFSGSENCLLIVICCASVRAGGAGAVLKVEVGGVGDVKDENIKDEEDWDMRLAVDVIVAGTLEELPEVVGDVKAEEDWDTDIKLAVDVVVGTLEELSEMALDDDDVSATAGTFSGDATNEAVEEGKFNGDAANGAVGEEEDADAVLEVIAAGVVVPVEAVIEVDPTVSEAVDRIAVDADLWEAVEVLVIVDFDVEDAEALMVKLCEGKLPGPPS